MCILGDSFMLAFLGICSWHDWKKRSVPMWLLCIYSLVTVWLVLCVKELETGEILKGFAFGLLFFGISFFTKEAIGYGDSWIITILGCYMGIKSLLWVLFLASFCASFVSLFQLWKMQWKREYALPFVPFMMMAFVGVTFL